MPAQVTGVDVHRRRGIAGQRVDGVANHVEPFLALVTRQAVGHGECIGFDDDRRRRRAQVGGDAVDPASVVGAPSEPARGEAAAVAVRDSIERQHRHRAGGLRVTDVLRDRGCRRARDEPVRLRRVGDGGQLWTRRIGFLRGTHGRRCGIDVERRSGQRVHRHRPGAPPGRPTCTGTAEQTMAATAAAVRNGRIHRATAPAAEDITPRK